MKIGELLNKLEAEQYVADANLATTLLLAKNLNRPLLLEGDAGVGKTALASTLANALNTTLFRIQCYEGLDAEQVIYSWNTAAQLMHIRLNENTQQNLTSSDIYDEQFLSQRPLLAAIRQKEPAVLLIDEIDRADEAFEAFLLETLSEFQVSIPEIGTIKATSYPIVILTSNATRDLSDALRRRCLYHYLGYPSVDKEMQILKTHLPNIDGALTAQISRIMQFLRQQGLRKNPGVAESIDWAKSLLALGIDDIHDNNAANTLGTVLKTKEDTDWLSHHSLSEIAAKAIGT